MCPSLKMRYYFQQKFKLPSIKFKSGIISWKKETHYREKQYIVYNKKVWKVENRMENL